MKLGHANAADLTVQCLTVPDCVFQKVVPATPDVSAQADSQGHTGLEAPSAKRLKTQFRCSKCGFITSKSAAFQRHIPQHKRDKNTPQCLHCGLCFTSVFSLSRHLFIVHKVKDVEKAGGGREKQAEGDGQTSADADETNDFEPSLEGETENLQRSETTDSRVKRRSRTEAATPAVRTT